MCWNRHSIKQLSLTCPVMTLYTQSNPTTSLEEKKTLENMKANLYKSKGKRFAKRKTSILYNNNIPIPYYQSHNFIFYTLHRAYHIYDMLDLCYMNKLDLWAFSWFYFYSLIFYHILYSRVIYTCGVVNCPYFYLIPSLLLSCYYNALYANRASCPNRVTSEKLLL